MSPPPAHQNISRAMAGAVPCDVSLKRVVSIVSPEQKYPWVLDNIECIDGIEFVALKQRCTGFCRFVSGAIRDFQRDGASYLQSLVTLRTQATIASLGDPDPSPFGDVEQTSAAIRKARKVAKTKAANGHMPSHVEVTCPRVGMQDGRHVGPMSFKMEASIDPRDAPTVELEPYVLHYIKYAMLAFECSNDNRDLRSLINGIIELAQISFNSEFACLTQRTAILA